MATRKLLIICLLLFIFPFILMAQEKEEKRLELKNGTVLTGYVEVQPDGSYLLETQSGDVFFFSPSEVAKVMSLLPASQQTTGVSDYFDGKTVDKRRGKIYMLATEEELTKNDFMTYQGWEKYQKAKKTRKTGNILLISAGGVAGLGLVLGGTFAIIEEDEDPLIAAAVGFGIGALIAIPGLILCISGNKQLIKIQDAYNQTPGYVLDFGVQQHGVGFALKF